MALQHDEQGFLLGPRIDTEQITGQLESIHDELRAIRAALGGEPGAPIAPTPAPAVAPSSEPVIALPRSDRGAGSRAQLSVVRERVDTGEARADSAETGAQPLAVLPAAALAVSVKVVAAALKDAPAPEPATKTPAVRAKRGDERAVKNGRDSSGRFVGKGAAGRAAGDGDDSAAASAISGVGERIAGAISEIGAGSEEADPSVKAFSEIAQPLSRGFGKIFGGGQDRKQERWYRRFLREMSQKRREDQAANKATQRTLKNIEAKPDGEDSGGSGILGFVGLLLAPFLALFGKLLAALAFLSRLSGLTRLLALMAGAAGLLKRLVPPGVRKLFSGKKDGVDSSSKARPGPAAAAGAARPGAKAGDSADTKDRGASAGQAGKGARGLLKKIPYLGALLSAGMAVGDIVASESGEGSRREKDAATGSAVGRGIGGLGGMAGGAAVGAAIGSAVPVVGTLVGGLVGAALGGFLGDSAGDVIGEKFGLWVNDLRNSGIAQSMLDGWNLTTDFFSSLWQQTSAGFAARWEAVSASMGEAWSVVSTGASALWATVAGTVTAGWTALSGALSGAWTAAVGEMQKGWSAAIDLAAKGWEALSGFAGKAGDWLKDKTGVDLKKAYSSARDSADSLIDGAKGAVSSAMDKVSSVASSAVASVKSGVAAVADASGVSTAIRTVKGAASYATGKKALRHAMAGANITDPNEQAAFMAQMDHESGGFSQMEESFNYKSADRLMAVSGSAKAKGKPAIEAAMARGPEAVAELMYGGRMGNVNPGDAHAFRGRGFTQLTGRDNYTAASKALGIDLVSNPDLAADPEVAAKVATWYWKSKPGLSEAAKGGDVTAVTKKINGGANGLADRQAKTQKYLAEAQSGGLTVAPAAVVDVATAPSPEQAAPATASAGNPFAGLANGVDSAPASPGNPFGALEEAAAPATASAGNPFAGLLGRSAAVSVPPALARTPSIPSVPTPGITNIAEAPSIQIPMGSTGKSGGRQQGATQDVPRDLPDRRIAHIVTGAYSGMG